MKSSESGDKFVSPQEKQIQEEFSQRWEVYRIVTHELGGLHLLPLFDTTYSTKQLYDLLEVCDVHDAIKKTAYEKAKAESNKK